MKENTVISYVQSFSLYNIMALSKKSIYDIDEIINENSFDFNSNYLESVLQVLADITSDIEEYAYDGVASQIECESICRNLVDIYIHHNEVLKFNLENFEEIPYKAFDSINKIVC